MFVSFQGARVWLPDREYVWRAVTVAGNYDGKGQLEVISAEGANEIIPIKSDSDLPPLRNPEILIGQKDLTALSYLNEPEVLYNLESRFNKSQIYTKCGIVLVAINPYESLSIYGNDTIQLYRDQDVQLLEPHIFATAELAYQSMVNFSKNQSIIVSGESGAGKTVSAKYAMRYFANVGGLLEETQIEKKVLASSPIMEAIGNAKTIRNDNSSRFGKYIEIGFLRNHICGASMRTYLLEKSRVIYQAPDERNYHIFYQLCTQVNQSEMKSLALLSADQFRYTSEGNAITIKGVNDAQQFLETREALTLLGIENKVQLSIFRLLSAILHLGNVIIHEGEGETSYVKESDKSFSIFCSLLKLDENRMRTWLCNKRIKTGVEVVNTTLTLNQALFARDALAKHIYSQLFGWIVDEINKSLEYIGQRQSFIGVLDIYGFETFEINSFEQFCINYANEKLQQQFCQHVFKLEQEEYMKEEITWSFIQFYDNQPCIDLIENKLGILDLLDEECKMPKGSDENWHRKLVTQHGKHADFSTKKLTAHTTFIINHFAEKVEYSIEGFLEKNRDTVLEDQLKMLKESEFEFVVQLFMEEDDGMKNAASKKSYQVQKTGTLQATSKTQAQRKKTVGSQFRESLTSLMTALNSTEPHYVRCIKPNDAKASFTFEPRRAVQQLRACGVLETVRISAAGYPSRWSYHDFFVRYRLLTRSALIDRTNYRRTCENILKNLISDPDKYQFGNTKIFFRAGQVAYLEKLRSEKLRACIIKIQTTYRTYYARKRYLKIRRTTLALQCLSRRYLARKHAEDIRRTRAVTLFQSLWRRQIAARRFEKLRIILIDIQSHCRGYLIRKNLQQRMLERSVLVLQSSIRMWIARQRFVTFQRAIILLQSHQRRREACQEVKKLRVEQRSIEHQKQMNKGLENKIISLQHKIDEQKRDNERLTNKEQELENLKKDFEQLKTKNKELKQNLKKQTNLEEEIQQLRLENERLKTENSSIRSDLIQTKQTKDEIILKNTDLITQLENEIEQKNKDIQKLEEQLRGDLSTQDLSTTRMKQLEEELTAERQQRQRLVIEMHRLEQKCDNLQSELQNGNMINKVKSAPSDSNMTWDSKFMDTLDLDDLPVNTFCHYSKKCGNIGGGLLFRLQRRLRQLEQENKTMNEELDKGQTNSSKLSSMKRNSSWHLDELEMDKLRTDLKALREEVLKGDEQAAKEQLIAQFDALNAELEHRRREQIEMKSKLQERVMQHENETDDVIASDAIEQAYQSQKQINKMLELELEQCRASYQREYERTQERLTQVEAENLELCKSIDENTIDDSMKQQIAHVVHENLELHQQIQSNNAEIRKLRRVIKLVNKSFSAGNVSWEQVLQNGSMNGIPSFNGHNDASNSMSLTTTATVTNNVPGNVDLRRQSIRHFSGMIKCNPQETERITDAVIIELKPRLAAKYIPGIPAYILFMCIRYIDFVDDEAHVAGFLSAVTKKIKKVPRRNEDIDYPILWTANTVRFLHTLQQYSGEEKYQATNTPKQNEQALRNFDLTDYRTIFADLVVHLYDEILKRVKAKLLPMIIPAIIEHEDLDSGGIASVNPSLPGNNANEKRSKFSAQDLLKQLNDYHKLCQMYSVEPIIIQQLFRQIFYIIDAQALRGLLVRSDCCNWSKALQIRYNLNHLTEWLRDQNLQDSGASDCLLPLTQAVQLFLCKKDEASISNVCTKLTIVQVTKLLSLYKSMDDFDDQVSPALIKRVSDLLKQQRLGSTTDRTRIDYEQQENFDLTYTFPLVYPYVPSTVSLDQLDIPHELHLDFLSLV
uniref:Myosin V-like protein n=1 Tax=Adineta vaga TaxID=104782 RepID=D4NWD9_ADIVA|nr:myosin V-like protein [Adineta vaga]